MTDLKYLKYYAPDYPRTKHLPFQANAKRDDLIASDQEVKCIFESNYTDVTEKIDGSSCRMTMIEGQPLIGNRNHILDKSYTSTKRKNSSKMQFSSIWNWWYDHKECFELLGAAGPYSVYGDWMYMAHGMLYDGLPSLFMCYDLFDYEKQYFVDTIISRKILSSCGFTVVPLLHYGKVPSYEFLAELCNTKSTFSTESREGIYVKVSDGNRVLDRLKMVRSNFVQGALLDQTRIIRNKIQECNDCVTTKEGNSEQISDSSI